MDIRLVKIDEMARGTSEDDLVIAVIGTQGEQWYLAGYSPDGTLIPPVPINEADAPALLDSAGLYGVPDEQVGAVRERHVTVAFEPPLILDQLFDGNHVSRVVREHRTLT